MQGDLQCIGGIPVSRHDVDNLVAHVWATPGSIEQTDLEVAAQFLRIAADVVAVRIWRDPSSADQLYEAFLDDVLALTPDDDGGPRSRGG